MRARRGRVEPLPPVADRDRAPGLVDGHGHGERVAGGVEDGVVARFGRREHDLLAVVAGHTRRAQRLADDGAHGGYRRRLAPKPGARTHVHRRTPYPPPRSDKPQVAGAMGAVPPPIGSLRTHRRPEVVVSQADPVDRPRTPGQTWTHYD